MAAGSGSLYSSQARRYQTDFGAELDAIRKELGESPLANRVVHLQGLFAEGIEPNIPDCQQRILQQVREAFSQGDLGRAESILADRVFEVKIGDADITADLRAQIDAAKAKIAEAAAQAEKDTEAAGHLDEAEKAMERFDFSKAREALDQAKACNPQNGALERLHVVEGEYAHRPTKQTLNTLIKECDSGTDARRQDEAEEAERQRKRALSRTNSASSAPMGSPEPRVAAGPEASPPATVAEAPTPKAAAAPKADDDDKPLARP